MKITSYHIFKKILFTLIIISCLLSFTKADDIREFEIESISIGDSLLEHFEKKQIEKFVNYDDLPSDMQYRIAEIYNGQDLNMTNYDAMQFYYKPNDPNFIIQSLSGLIDCGNKNKCDKIFMRVVDDLSRIYGVGNKNTVVHPDDKTGKSVHTYYEFSLNSGSITATNRLWSDAVEYTSVVSVALFSDKIIKWIKSGWGVN